MKLEFSRQIFEKCSNIKFYKIPSSGNRVVPWGQTDKHDETIAAFRNFAKELKMVQKQKSLLTKGEYYLLVKHTNVILNVLLKCSYIVINTVLPFSVNRITLKSYNISKYGHHPHTATNCGKQTVARYRMFTVFIIFSCDYVISLYKIKKKNLRFRSKNVSKPNLTLSLLMSCIYMELLVKPEIIKSYMYGPTFCIAESRLYLLHNVSTLNQCRKISCVTFVCKHFASYQVYHNYKWDLIR
jgi:hypothetical protein